MNVAEAKNQGHRSERALNLYSVINQGFPKKPFSEWAKHQDRPKKKDLERSPMTLSSPRLELGISRVSGGRINQLSHEDASSFRSLPDFGLHIVLTQSKIALVKREKVVQRAEGKRKGSARLEKGFKPNRGS